MTRRTLLLSASALAAVRAADDGLIPVKVKRKPTDEWKIMPARDIQHVSGFQPGVKKVRVSQYGGRLDRRVDAAGFFRAVENKGRWWLADPEGFLYLKAGVATVGPGSSAVNRAALKEQFGTPGRWAEATVKLLRENGFNGAGAWSSVDLLRATPDRLVYTQIWNFMSAFGKQKKLTFQQSGHTGYAGDCIPVFHPEFESFCDEYARQLSATKEDPWLLGHFSDNEMPAPADLLDRALKLDAANPALAPTAEYANKWLAGQKPTPQLNDAFREHVFDRYFEITTKAIRKHDPNHLCLGSRLNAGAVTSPGILRAAGKHLDVVAMNIYRVWSPGPDLFELWRGKPMMVTEFYAKGEDSGYKNTTGAGWLVPTQRDRALFYQNFLLGMMESKVCVGWDWFKYMDNDPEDLSTDPSNRDSNKGIVTIRYKPYAGLVDGMREFNREIYPLADHFDRV